MKNNYLYYTNQKLKNYETTITRYCRFRCSVWSWLYWGSHLFYFSCHYFLDRCSGISESNYLACASCVSSVRKIRNVSYQIKIIKKNNNKIKYIHTNIIARDWRKLAQFYIDVFGCEAVYPERDLSGEWMDKLTNIKDVHVRGIHLRLPGYENGPTLEIFQYNQSIIRDDDPEINAQGFAHIAFHTDHVEDLVQKVIKNGGSLYGDQVEKEIEGVGNIKVIYVKDTEGNVIEIQSVRS